MSLRLRWPPRLPALPPLLSVHIAQRMYGHSSVPASTAPSVHPSSPNPTMLTLPRGPLLPPPLQLPRVRLSISLSLSRPRPAQLQEGKTRLLVLCMA